MPTHAALLVSRNIEHVVVAFGHTATHGISSYFFNLGTKAFIVITPEQTDPREEICVICFLISKTHIILFECFFLKHPNTHHL
jgi:hypothetical protein